MRIVRQCETRHSQSEVVPRWVNPCEVSRTEFASLAPPPAADPPAPSPLVEFGNKPFGRRRTKGLLEHAGYLPPVEFRRVQEYTQPILERARCARRWLEESLGFGGNHFLLSTRSYPEPPSGRGLSE